MKRAEEGAAQQLQQNCSHSDQHGVSTVDAVDADLSVGTCTATSNFFIIRSEPPMGEGVCGADGDGDGGGGVNEPKSKPAS